MATQHGNKILVKVLLTPEQYQNLKEQAKKENRSVSNCVAVLVERGIEKK